MTPTELKVALLKAKRSEMIDYLTRQKAFNPKAAIIAVDNFLSTLEFVFQETGSLL